MKTLLISGKSGSGKDQLGMYIQKILQQQQNQRVLVIHFGDAVKFFLKQYYNWNGIKDEHGRKLLQHLGTTIMRHQFPTYWAELVAKFIHATNSDWDYVIIPDLRFINELYTIKRFNSDIITIRINRFNEDGTEYFNPYLSEEQRDHISECEFDDYACDWYINNDGTIDDLYVSAQQLLKEINNVIT